MNNKYSLPKDGGLIEVSAPRDIIHRYEKIHTTVYENEYLGVQYVADTIVKAIRTYNEIRLFERGLRGVAAVRAGAHDRAHPARAVPRTGQNATRRGSSASATWRYSASTSSTRSARPNSRAAISASTRFPQPYRHPARKYPHP